MAELTARELQELAHDAEELERRTAEMELSVEGAAAAANPIQVFCGQVWPVLRPILEFVLKIPLVPGGVKNTIRNIIRICDGLCGGNR